MDLEPNISTMLHLFWLILKLVIFIHKQLKRPAAALSVQCKGKNIMLLTTNQSTCVQLFWHACCVKCPSKFFKGEAGPFCVMVTTLNSKKSCIVIIVFIDLN